MDQPYKTRFKLGRSLVKRVFNSSNLMVLFALYQSIDICGTTMGIIRTAVTAGLWGMTGGVASVGAGMAYIAAGTTLVDLTKSDTWFKTKTYLKYNPKGNPALADDCIKRVPLRRIRPDLRDNEEALTLEFCRGVWGRWGMPPCRDNHFFPKH